MAQTIIVPTILTADPNEYKDLMGLYFPFTKRAQIDVSDGTLAENKTIPLSSVWWPKGWMADLHMITATPSAHMATLLKLKPNLVILHSEIKEDLTASIKELKANGIGVGIAVMREVYPGTIKHLIAEADHVMIFSGNLGKNGGEADLMQLEKIKIIHKIKTEIEIGWDGGANLSNVRFLAQAKVDVINVGSSLKNASDPAKAYQALSAEIEKPGVM